MHRSVVAVTLSPMRRHSALRITAMLTLILLGVGFAQSTAEASSEAPPGYAAVVRGVIGRMGWISMKGFEKRKAQVRAERRLPGAADGIPVGEESLWQLLEEVEVEAEALRMDLRVGSHRVAREFRRVKHRNFASIDKFHAFLKEIHLTEDEARHRIKGQLLFSLIKDHVLNGVTPQRRSIALRRFSDAYLRRWRSRTICRQAIATERCSNGPPLSLEAGASLGTGPVPRKASN